MQFIKSPLITIGKYYYLIVTVWSVLYVLSTISLYLRESDITTYPFIHLPNTIIFIVLVISRLRYLNRNLVWALPLLLLPAFLNAPVTILAQSLLQGHFYSSVIIYSIIKLVIVSLCILPTFLLIFFLKNKEEVIDGIPVHTDNIYTDSPKYDSGYVGSPEIGK